jgi:two-component system sensor histidine kinase CreC
MEEDMPPETRTRFLENILAETARSERLINRLLELSAVESRKSLDDAEECEMGGLVASVIEQARPMADIAHVALSYAPPISPVKVRGDAFILRAAVTNLLENAIDFSPAGSVVEISLDRHGVSARLIIHDHGEGIPDFARDKVFERFYSLRHHHVGRKGTGLGLTLVKEAADLHGGTVSLEPADGGGTVATLSLPAY